MAQIKREDLEFLTSEQIREIYAEKDWKKHPDVIRNYIENYIENTTIFSRINRIHRLLETIIIDRFIENKPKPKTLTKHTVCGACHSIGITYNDCVCTYQNDYPVITLEFEQCGCCGNIEDGSPAYTEFNENALIVYHKQQEKELKIWKKEQKEREKKRKENEKR